MIKQKERNLLKKLGKKNKKRLHGKFKWRSNIENGIAKKNNEEFTNEVQNEQRNDNGRKRTERH